jgi:fructokinase
VTHEHGPKPPATEVVAIGESLVDVVVSADGGRTAEHPGGSPMNIALGLARLGRPVTLVTHIGLDARGESIARHLNGAGVTIAAGSLRDERTSTATAHLKADGSAEYVFDLRWALPADHAVDGLLSKRAALVHVGSIGAFLEPGGSAVLSLLRQMTNREDPPLILLDPNVRPSILRDHVTAVARFEHIAALASVVKLSDEDADWLYPESSLEDAIELILRLGPALVAITRGGDGAVLATHTTRVAIPGVAVKVADTIGAGDSFMSALIDCIAGLRDDGVPTGALRDGRAFDAKRLTTIGYYAARCAAITVSRPGADPPTQIEFEAAKL